MKKYFCYQGNNHDCGFAALKMLLATVHENKSFLYLAKNKGKKGNYTFRELIDIAKENGVIMRAYECDNSQLDKITLPCLALINSNHVVMITSLSRKYIKISDPDKGMLKIKRASFEKTWRQRVLEISDVAEHCFHKQNFLTEFPSHKNQVIKLIIKFVSTASILTGFFFVKEDSFVFIPIIFLVVFALLELVEKWYKIKEINFFDKTFIQKIFSRKENQNNKTYNLYNEFKKSYCLYFDEFITYSLSFALISFVLIINNPINSIAIIFILLSLLVKKLILGNKRNDQKREIALLEDGLSEAKEDYLSIVDKCVSSANNFALKISFEKCIHSFLLIIICILSMIYCKTISVNFILFHFGAFYILSNNMESLISYKENIETYKRLEAQFIDHIDN